MSVVDVVLPRPKGPRVGEGDYFADSEGVVELDCSISEDEENDADVLEHPVERGTPIADHRSLKPTVLRLSALVSNNPTYIEDHLANLASGGDRAREQYDAIQKLYKRSSGELLKIVTGLRTYKDMEFRSLRTRRQPGAAGALEFTAEFVQVRFADSATVAVAEDVKHTAGPKKETPGADTIPTEVPGASILKGAQDALGHAMGLP